VEKLEHVMVVSIVSSLKNPSAQYQLYAELDDLFKEMEWATGVKVVVLGGNTGESFPEGWERTKTVSREKVEPDGRLVNITEPIAKMDGPVIAAINGYVLGQGLELALACDMRMGAEDCRFGFPHVKGAIDEKHTVVRHTSSPVPYNSGTNGMGSHRGTGSCCFSSRCTRHYWAKRWHDQPTGGR
jgi:enoyl-CoA hydratase/carnithine racemase